VSSFNLGIRDKAVLLGDGVVGALPTGVGPKASMTFLMSATHLSLSEFLSTKSSVNTPAWVVTLNAERPGNSSTRPTLAPARSMERSATRLDLDGLG